jgi:hypothetical protein
MRKFNTLTLIDVQRELYLIDSQSRKENSHYSFCLSSLFQRLLYKNNNNLIEFARYGIERHFYYCKRTDCFYDADAIREIIYDAMNGQTQAFSNEIDIDTTNYSTVSGSYQYLQDLLGGARRVNKRLATV